MESGNAAAAATAEHQSLPLPDSFILEENFVWQKQVARKYILHQILLRLSCIARRVMHTMHVVPVNVGQRVCSSREDLFTVAGNFGLLEN